MRRPAATEFQKKEREREKKMIPAWSLVLCKYALINIHRLKHQYWLILVQVEVS